MHRVKIIACNALRVLTLAGLVVHFGLTLFYVLPINPVRLVIEPWLQASIGTFFSQNWSLFAPNPLSSTQTLMVRCLSKQEHPAADSALPPDGWADLSSPLFVRAQHQRLSAYERMVRPQENAVRAYIGNAVEFQPLIDRCTKGEKPACEVLSAIIKVRKTAASVLLARLGSVYCREAHPGAGIDAVAMRYRERAAIPWSERFTGTAKTTDFNLGVYPIDQQVVLPRLYIAAGNP